MIRKEVQFAPEKRISKLVPSLEQAREFAHYGYKIIPIYQTLAGDLETPGRVYLKLTQEKSSQWAPSFLLESVEGGETVGRFSYVGVNPKLGIEVFPEGGWIERHPDGSSILHDRHISIDSLRIIESRMPRPNSVAPVSDLPPFPGGFVGYLGYECISRWEPTVPTHPDTVGIPDAIFFETGDLIVFDHVKQRMKVLTSISVEDPSEIDRQYREAVGRIESVVDKLRRPLDPPLEHPPVKEPPAENEITSNFTQEQYEAVVENAKEHIYAGDIFQIVTSQRLSKKTSAEPYTIYRHFRQESPSPYNVFINLENFQLISASPEINVKVEGRRILYRPLAGTRPRGRSKEGDIDVEKDLALERDLIEDPKERAEHVMLVDLGRNDVGRVARWGTERVTKLMVVERYSKVMHIASQIEAELDPKYTCFDAIRACFPAGTVTGAPKVEAMRLIHKFEPTRRGPYSGALGYISYSWDTTMAIAIRTLVKIGNEVFAQSGGGIVADSVPTTEFEETMHKASAGLSALDLAEKEEL